ncbi:MAG: response regulator [Gemmatimonadetes bacterium]|nr:response regulator [Gemmatimonadota bacterium]
MSATASPRLQRRILWVDDEVELLRPHLLFLRDRGYAVDGVSNGDDALELLAERTYDLALLDEQMPGRTGLELLEVLRREMPQQRVVMLTKSQDDATMTGAIGRSVEDYLVKPVSPLQLLSAVTRVLEGPSIRQQSLAQDFAARFGRLSIDLKDAGEADDYAAVYSELTDWHVSLSEAGETGLLDTVSSLMADLRRDFGGWVVRNYPAWLAADANGDDAGGQVPTGYDVPSWNRPGGSGRGRKRKSRRRRPSERPLLSVDVVRKHLAPRVGDAPVCFVVLDCMRLDQWRVMAPLLAEHFEIEESHHFAILPTATPFARNALFSGMFPDEIARRYPDWWGGRDKEGSMNAFEDDLLRKQLRRLTGRDVSVHYEKVFTDRRGDQVRSRVVSALGRAGSVIALVFNFVDLMTHGRSESPILMEVVRDEAALRSLTRAWFERSVAFRVLREAARSGVRVVLTTDHGSILCQHPSTVVARRDATPSLRYKFGQDLRAEVGSTAYSTQDSRDLRMPPARMGMTYLLAREGYFFVYPTKLREYQARYLNSFLHGGISPEEMIVPVANLTPR